MGLETSTEPMFHSAFNSSMPLYAPHVISDLLWRDMVLHGWLEFLRILQAIQTVLALNHLFKDVFSVFVQPWKTDSSVCPSTRWECFVQTKRWRLQKLYVLTTHATDCADVTRTIVSPGTEISPIFRPLTVLLIMKPFSLTEVSQIVCQPPWKPICYLLYKKVKPETFHSSWHQLIKIPVYKTISQAHQGDCLASVTLHFSANYPGKAHFVPVPRTQRTGASIHILLPALKGHRMEARVQILYLNNERKGKWQSRRR